MGDKKALPNKKRWDVYVNLKGTFIKGGYSVEVVNSYRNKVI